MPSLHTRIEPCLGCRGFGTMPGHFVSKLGPLPQWRLQTICSSCGGLGIRIYNDQRFVQLTSQLTSARATFERRATSVPAFVAPALRAAVLWDVCKIARDLRHEFGAHAPRENLCAALHDGWLGDDWVRLAQYRDWYRSYLGVLCGDQLLDAERDCITGWLDVAHHRSRAATRNAIESAHQLTQITPDGTKRSIVRLLMAIWHLTTKPCVQVPFNLISNALARRPKRVAMCRFRLMLLPQMGLSPKATKRIELETRWQLLHCDDLHNNWPFARPFVTTIQFRSN